jgi:hypothetical protein
VTNLSPYEATLGEDTMHEILRRYPDESYDRNITDPHPFVMCSFEVYRTRATTQPGVKVGW